ncbi:MAG: hypothetical protein HQL88_02025 [Magnetococcales bacterium]|nr:hypothetical protein [Magnetococcales bacterium]
MLFQSKRLYFVSVVQEAQAGLLVRLQRQLLGLLSLLLGLFLGIPGVPGPGFVFVALALVLLDFPGKNRLFGLLRHKRWFRVARVMIRQKMRVLLVLPKRALPSQMHS